MLFLRGQAPIHAYIAWHDHDAMIQEVANHCLVPVHRVLQLLDPEDLRAIKDLYPMIVQREFDVEPGSHEQLCLLDIELYGQRHEPHYFTGPRVNRAVWLIPKQLVRRTLLRIIGQDDHCIRASQRCIVKMNGDIWNVQDARPRHIQHGDHFCIQIPPVEDCPHSHILRAWTGNEAVVANRGSPSYSPSIGPTASQSSFDLERLLDSDDASLFQSHIGSFQCILKTIQHDISGAHLSGDNSGENPESIPLDEVPAQYGQEELTDESDSLPVWVHSLQALFQGEFSTLEMPEREGPYIQTWYLNHHDHLRCDPGRPLLLDSNPTDWQRAAKDLWVDVIDVDSPCWFELVTPTPLPVGTQRFIAHLMISQHRDDSVLLADRRVETVTTIIYEHPSRPRMRQLALVMPSWRSWSLADDFFHVLCVHQLCIQRRASGRQCFIVRGPNVLELGLRDLFHHGDSLTIHIPEAPTSTTRGTGLLQRTTTTQTIMQPGHTTEPTITVDFLPVLQLREELEQLH